MTRTIEQLNKSYSDFIPPFDVTDQYALLFSYRRVLAQLLAYEERIKNLENNRKELTLMIEEWIGKNPTYSAKVNADNWKPTV